MNKEQRTLAKQALIHDLVITAIEGGSNHWLAMFAMGNAKGEEVSYLEPFLGIEGLTTAFITEDDFERRITTPLQIPGAAPYITGLRKWTLWRFNRKQPITDWGDIDFDAEDADVFMQFSLLGDIVYG